jgi:hypothetical protein
VASSVDAPLSACPFGDTLSSSLQRFSLSITKGPQ